MTVSKLKAGLLAAVGLTAAAMAQKFPKEDLVLCDCGIGDNKEHEDWSTSRQMNWYQDITWPRSGYTYPEAPDMVVQVPYKDGKYPWEPTGVTATMPNGHVWTAYIEGGTPDGFKAGYAVSPKEGGQLLHCWAYRGRPVSGAINKTVNHDAVCWSAFVCSRSNKPPPRPKDMGSRTSLTTSPAAPSTSVFSEPPATLYPTTVSGHAAPTPVPRVGSLSVSTTVNPRFINWQDTWQAFINHFVWDKNTGGCVGGPAQGNGFSISFDCFGVQIDEDTHMTLLLIKALRDVGVNSLWFNQNPIVPGNGTSTQHQSWVVMPESFTIQAKDSSNNNVVGRLSYKTRYDGFLAGTCSVCETGRFNRQYFDPIIAAVQGSYPVYNNFTIEARCDPWMVCL
ncbi:hypothetical protein RJ55_00978 [Drechmeria coniospora]|nr:hypothetical protein RJ55_00978 [Drechmeria coniospora]